MLPQTVSDIFEIRKQSHAQLWFAKPPEDVEGPEACKPLSYCPESRLWLSLERHKEPLLSVQVGG